MAWKNASASPWNALVCRRRWGDINLVTETSSQMDTFYFSPYELHVLLLIEAVQACALVWVIRELRRTRHVGANQQAVLRRTLNRIGFGQTPAE